MMVVLMLGVTLLVALAMRHFVDAARPVQEYFIEKFGADVCAAWGLE